MYGVICDTCVAFFFKWYHILGKNECFFQSSEIMFVYQIFMVVKLPIQSTRA